MKKEFLVYISIVVLSLAFILISILVKWNQNNKRLIARKIKLGATLITLTAVLNSCSGPMPGVATCYDIAEPDSNINIIKKDTLTTDTVANGVDSVRIKSPINRATCYGAPANYNNIKNE